MKLVCSILCASLAAVAAADCPRIVLELPPGPDNPRNSEGTFATLRDGSVMYAYSRFRGDDKSDHATADIAARRSSDGGLTWTQTDEVLVPSGEGGMNVCCASLLRLHNGDLALFYLRKNSLSDCVPVMRRSADDGATWGDPVVCITDEAGYYVLNNDRVIQLKGGRIIFAVSSLTAPDGSWDERGVVISYYSDDNGATWHRGGVVAQANFPNGGRISLQEPGVVELRDGRVFLWIRTNAGCQYCCYSHDRGETWTQPSPSPFASPLAPASIKRLPTGDLLALWNDHAARPEMKTRGAAWAYGARTPLAAAVSRDDGKTWSLARMLEDDPGGWYCYFAIHPIGDGTVLLGYCAYEELSHSRLAKVPIGWFYGACEDGNDALPRLDSTQFSYRYEMDSALPTSEDLDGDGAADFTFSGDGSLSLGTGADTGSSVFNATAGNAFIMSVADSGAGSVWRRSGIDLSTGYTVETCLKVSQATGSDGAAALNASVAGSTINGWLRFYTDKIVWSGATNLLDTTVYRTYRLVRGAGSAVHSLYVDGVLVRKNLGNGFATDGFLNRLLIGDAGVKYGGNVQVAYLRFTKGAYAPPLARFGVEARKSSAGFPRRYEMGAGDQRFAGPGEAH